MVVFRITSIEKDILKCMFKVFILSKVLIRYIVQTKWPNMSISKVLTTWIKYRFWNNFCYNSFICNCVQWYTKNCQQFASIFPGNNHRYVWIMNYFHVFLFILIHAIYVGSDRKVHSRKKRFVAFPEGSTFAVSIFSKLFA